MLISALSTTEDLMEFLTLVVPSENELMNVFNGLDQGSLDETVLKMLFDALATLSKSYNGSDDLLLAFLSLPWICEIEWTVLEGFQKSLAPLVVIKKKELLVKNIISCKLEFLIIFI